ncbi:phosphate ABC transporter permease subunit PstC [Vibrio marisflavi]|uniref:Phosphate transport system permease protein n=1 Tax=Vibrio marisflavi CECT 7928 TaxID=634439 RepID=A0ABM9A1J3_9VIBR|nr:phosphate ABC transporter permease subunit PstC [Vibrio marisflavi]CAH0537583.1 Phosphate transport system permease protein PstC [Vibrio marisflavi CECT 7928]
MTTTTLRNKVNGDSIFNKVSLFSALIIFITLAGLVISLFHGGWPAFEKFGLSFIYKSEWDPVGGNFGVAAEIYGTLVSSLIAIIIAVPVSLGTAIFLAELTPTWVSEPVGKAVELLAAVPSIIYGMWGLFVFAPWFSNGFQTWAGDHLVGLPIIGPLFDGPPIGIGLMTAGIILSIMILPIMTSFARDALNSIPNVVREAAYGIGATNFEVIVKVLIPKVKNAIVSAGILGLGRALGETMAVAFVVGGSSSISESLFMPASTISATIAQQFGEATGNIYISSLIGLGAVLFVITFIVMILAKRLLRDSK